MFDLYFPIDENIALTKEVEEYAHQGVSVEAEVGTVVVLKIWLESTT